MIINKDDEQNFKCPECRSDININIDNLKKNFHLSQIIDSLSIHYKKLESLASTKKNDAEHLIQQINTKTMEFGNVNKILDNILKSLLENKEKHVQIINQLFNEIKQLLDNKKNNLLVENEKIIDQKVNLFKHEQNNIKKYISDINLEINLILDIFDNNLHTLDFLESESKLKSILSNIDADILKYNFNVQSIMHESEVEFVQYNNILHEGLCDEIALLSSPFNNITTGTGQNFAAVRLHNLINNFGKFYTKVIASEEYSIIDEIMLGLDNQFTKNTHQHDIHRTSPCYTSEADFKIKLIVFDQNNNRKNYGGDVISLVSEPNLSNFYVIDQNNGEYNIHGKFNCEGEHKLNIQINGKQLKHNPLINYQVANPDNTIFRNYTRNIINGLFTFTIVLYDNKNKRKKFSSNETIKIVANIGSEVNDNHIDLLYQVNDIGKGKFNVNGYFTSFCDYTLQIFINGKTNPKKMSFTNKSLNINDNCNCTITYETIIDRYINKLIRHKNKEWIFSNLDIDDNECVKIANSLNDNNIVSLKLDNGKIGLKGIKYLANVMNKNNSITELQLHKNIIKPEDFKFIAEMINNNKTITQLWLGGNYCGNIGAKYLSEVLHKNSTLIDLGLSNTILGLDGLICLTPAIVNNKSIKTLSLHWNCLGKNSGKYICEILQKNTSIETIYTYNNEIGDKGINLILDVLENINTLNPKSQLKVIDIRYNDIKNHSIYKRINDISEQYKNKFKIIIEPNTANTLNSSTTTNIINASTTTSGTKKKNKKSRR
jgi:hypothetical protein